MDTPKIEDLGTLADREDYGISMADAHAIKQAILLNVPGATTCPGEFYELAEDLMSAFKAIDAEAFIFAEHERKSREEAANLVDKRKPSDTIRTSGGS